LFEKVVAVITHDLLKPSRGRHASQLDVKKLDNLQRNNMYMYECKFLGHVLEIDIFPFYYLRRLTEKSCSNKEK